MVLISPEEGKNNSRRPARAAPLFSGRRMSPIDYLARAESAFSQIEVADALRKRAFENLTRWFTDATFRDARPQLEYLIETENFNALFDAFFQEIPFGTGGRKGPGGFWPDRTKSLPPATPHPGRFLF